MGTAETDRVMIIFHLFLYTQKTAKNPVMVILLTGKNKQLIVNKLKQL